MRFVAIAVVARSKYTKSTSSGGSLLLMMVVVADDSAGHGVDCVIIM